ncbi:MAG TPA: hypothetical protein VEV63_17050, partial [Streptosporangiaceae bacterium]|nr:hypothetical protein [Streptosporangiaceae bacterium]
MEAEETAVLRRVLGEVGGADLLDVLAVRLSGADLTSLLLEVMRQRADRLSPAEVLRQYRNDRFVSPAATDIRDMRRVEDAMFGALPADFDVLTLAPVLPLGAHSAVATVDPRNVIATIRRTEVAADPTNGLALEAAARRARLLDASPRSAEPVRLAASQRVTRAQQFEGPISFAHFQLLGVVTAGRDVGSHEFERTHLIEHLRLAVSGIAAVGAGVGEIKIAITRLDEAAAWILSAVEDAFAGVAGVQVADAPERESGRAYYRCLCFKVYVRFADQDGALSEPVEIGDGGFTDWTAKLLGNRKERLLISGHGLDRLAIMSRS